MKIKKQMEFLSELCCPQSELLKSYVDGTELNDRTNREGHAAKVYFDALFGLSFKRGDKTFLNGALNYGYTILLSAFNREIAGLGFNTQLGLAHKSRVQSIQSELRFGGAFQGDCGQSGVRKG